MTKKETDVKLKSGGFRNCVTKEIPFPKIWLSV
jgi:hypothetical protein